MTSGCNQRQLDEEMGAMRLIANEEELVVAIFGVTWEGMTRVLKSLQSKGPEFQSLLEACQENRAASFE